MADQQHNSHGAHQTVACDGGNGSLGHPRVFLELDANGQVVCPYCSKHLTQDDLVDEA